jgi:SAM-dependent methyltransferase
MIEKAVSKESYLRISYDEKRIPRTSYPLKLAQHLLDKHLKQCGVILDVGCGRGDFLEAFADLGFTVTGTDISPYVRDLKIPFDVAKCDFENEDLPFPSDSYDFIFSKSVVEHLRCPDKLTGQCFRVLKPKGKAIFMCPSWVHTFWGPFYIDHTHVTPFTLPSLSQLLELSGFQVVFAEHFIQLPILWGMPTLKIFSELTRLLPIPFRPLYKSSLPEWLNKWVRFSKEKMLLVVAEKP